MLKKDFGLFALIIVVGTVVALINPRFLSSSNIANTANLVGLFGMFSIAQAFVVITGGIELSVGSMIALLGVIFIDLIAVRGVPWPLAALIVLSLGFVMGLLHGLLVTKMRMQPFVVTLCGLLIYRGIARFYTADQIVAQFCAAEGSPRLTFHYRSFPSRKGRLLLAEDFRSAHHFPLLVVPDHPQGIRHPRPEGQRDHRLAVHQITRRDGFHDATLLGSLGDREKHRLQIQSLGQF